MRNWRVITAITTVVLAAAAALLTYGYLSNADQRAQDKVRQVPVYVAKADIPAGTSSEDAFTRGWITQDKIPQKNVPALAITGPQSVAGRFAVGTLDKGQVITNDSFVTRTQLGGTLASQLAKGNQAISFSVDQSHGVANMITPGDSINVIVSLLNPNRDDPAVAAKLASGKAAPQHALTAFLLPALKVLAVGTAPQTTQATAQNTAQNASTGSTTTTTPSNAATQNLGLITVEVNARQAEQIAQAQALSGTIYVSLNPTGFDAKTFKFPVEVVDAANLFDQPLTEFDHLNSQIP